jgi:hypothetical protein
MQSKIDNLHVNNNSQAWLEGIKAFEYGHKLDDNPYKGKPGVDFVSWNDGWYVAQVALGTCEAHGNA